MNRNNKSNNNRKGNRRAYQLARRGFTARESPYLTFLDPHRYVSLRYSQVMTTSTATLVGNNQIFNLNSIFDPDRSGAGHQPYGFDQLSALYNRYRVLRTRWRIIFSPANASYHLVVLPLNGLLPAAIAGDTTFQAAAENPRAQFWVQGASGQSKIIQGNLALNDLNGCTSVEYKADDRFEAQISASPNEVMTLNIGLYNPNGSTIIINYQVDLTYEVDLHDIISIGGS